MQLRRILDILILIVPMFDGLAGHPLDTIVVFDQVSAVPVANDVWWYTSNPVRITIAPFVPYGEVNVNYSDEQGCYRRTTKPEKLDYIRAFTEGYGKTNDIYFYGNLKYQNGRAHKLKWNNVSFISENNPFVIADSTGGDYDNEIYSLEGMLASRSVKNRIKWGVGARYEVGQKNNQSDPRPLIQSMRSAIVPGVVALLNNWEIGANLTGEYFKEEIDFSVVDHHINHRYFRFKGLGQFQGKTDDNFSRDYLGHQLGGSLQTAYRTPSFVNLLDLSINSIYERAQEGGANTKYLAGDFEELVFELSDYIRISKSNKIHEFGATAQLSKIDGIWHDQKAKTADDGTRYWEIYHSAVKYTKKIIRTAMEYSFTKFQGSRPNTRVTGKVEYQSSQARYYPENYLEDINNLNLSLVGQKNWYAKRMNISLMLASSYRYNFSDELYSEGELKYLIAWPEHHYHTANLFNADAGLKAGFPGLWGDKVYPFIALEYKYQRVLNNNENYKNGDYRTLGQISAGFNF